MIVNTIWDTELADLSCFAKLVYIWSFTNQSCGMAGVYPVRPKQIALAVDLELDTVNDACVELESASMIVYDGQWLWVCARVKHMNTRTPQIAKSILKDLSVVPKDHPIIAAFTARYESESWLKLEGHPRVTRPSPEGQRNPVNNRDISTLTRPSPEGPLDDDVVNAVVVLFKELWPDDKIDLYHLRIVLERHAADLDVDQIRANAVAYLMSPGCAEDWPRWVKQAHLWAPKNLKAPKRPPSSTPTVYERDVA